MQMYLQGGYYGGSRYLKQETINTFNTCYFCEDDIRRGVGFDKPQLGDVGPTCGCVSLSSFGHSGFTGTFTWADPEEDIVYVFMSNRTFPDANNRKLIGSNLRSNIQQAIYEAIDFKNTESTELTENK
jgi:CubicO group peptidase (beta-lactamase class C family)